MTWKWGDLSWLINFSWLKSSHDSKNSSLMDNLIQGNWVDTNIVSVWKSRQRASIVGLLCTSLRRPPYVSHCGDRHQGEDEEEACPLRGDFPTLITSVTDLLVQNYFPSSWNIYQLKARVIAAAHSERKKVKTNAELLLEIIEFIVPSMEGTGWTIVSNGKMQTYVQFPWP